MRLIITFAVMTMAACSDHHHGESEANGQSNCTYNNFTTPTDYQAGGVQMIDLVEGYKVWTKRHGNSPMKVLILHGGPAGTHEYLESFQSFWRVLEPRAYTLGFFFTSYASRVELA